MTLRNQIQATRTEELLGERGNGDKRAVRANEMDGIIRQTLLLAQRESIRQARKAAAESETIYGLSSTSVADVLVANTRTQANPLTILSDAVAGFEQGGFSAVFEGYFDNLHVSRSFGNIAMFINGVFVARQRMGARFSDPAEGISSMIPFTVSGVFNTPGVAPTIQVRAYAFDADNETTAAAGFYIRAGRLIVSGGQ